MNLYAASSFYEDGIKQALAAYGMGRGQPTRQSLPQGPLHLGAERFSKILRDEDDHYQKPSDEGPRSRLERTPQWSKPTDLSAVESGVRG